MGVRPARREPLIAVESIIAEAGKGLVGDRYKTSTNGPRQVTLIQAEDLHAIASYLGHASVDPGLLRRNIVVQGINLLAMKDRCFRVGTALLEYTGECHPVHEWKKIWGQEGTTLYGGMAALRRGCLLTEK